MLSKHATTELHPCPPHFFFRCKTGCKSPTVCDPSGNPECLRSQMGTTTCSSNLLLTTGLFRFLFLHYLASINCTSLGVYLSFLSYPISGGVIFHNILSQPSCLHRNGNVFSSIHNSELSPFSSWLVQLKTCHFCLSLQSKSILGLVELFY